MNTLKKVLGPHKIGETTWEFVVWAPLLSSVQLHLLSPTSRIIPLEKDEQGYFSCSMEGLQDGYCYYFQTRQGIDRADPASHFQPKGVFGPSCLVNHTSFTWEDTAWKGQSFDQMIFYEIHVGTFTPEGTFDSAISKLDYLCDLGITAIELMPIAQFPGTRNWGYDGVFPFAVQNSYGGPHGLKKFVNECHKRQICVFLDVVYSHFGPEGNFLSDFMPWSSTSYHSPWGSSVNFDGPYSYGIREYFIQNSLYWLETYHLDGLRIDATHAIIDQSAKHFLQELSERVHEFSRDKQHPYYVIAESDLNEVRTILPFEKGGYNFRAQWNDDFHHALHSILTNERTGYYEDFGQIEQLAKAFKDGFVYAWEFSLYRKRFHGSSSKELPPSSFIVFSQNHDQIGNRTDGKRLSNLVSFDGLKLAAGLVIFSSNIPLLFMGEEYGETAPFLFFTDFFNPTLTGESHNTDQISHKEKFLLSKLH